MPRSMDVHHNVEGVMPEAIAAAHQADRATQEKYGVTLLTYWNDEATGKVFCLSEAPNIDGPNAVHREAHGILADEVYEVKEGH